MAWIIWNTIPVTIVSAMNKAGKPHIIFRLSHGCVMMGENEPSEGFVR